MYRRSSLPEVFVRVKSPMGLERFEVEIVFRLISQSLGISEGIGFWAKRNFAVFFRAGSCLISKTASVQLKTCILAFIYPNHIFGIKTLMGVE